MNQDLLNRRLRAVVLELQPRLLTAEVNDIFSYIDHNEPGVAFEVLCSQLYEHQDELSLHLAEQMAELGSAMSLPPRKWEGLRVANR